MRKSVAALTIAGCVACQGAWAQGIPTYDNTNLIQAVKQFEQLQRQYRTLESQLESAKRQVSQFDGSRGYSSAINSIYQYDYPAKVESILDDYGYVDDKQTVERQSREMDAQHLGEVDHYLDQTNDRYKELSRLVSEVDTAEDPKDVMDLQARIEAEQTMLQNEQLKVQLLSQRHEMQSKMQKMKREQRHEDAWESGTNIDAFSFNQ